MYTIEIIPDKDKVYYRIHNSFFRDGSLNPGVFIERNDGMSTDWEKYSKPEQSKQRAKNPSENGIISFITGQLRNLDLIVEHKPSPQNRSHSLVKGNDKKIHNNTKVRLKLLNLYKWEILIYQN